MTIISKILSWYDVAVILLGYKQLILLMFKLLSTP